MMLRGMQVVMPQKVHAVLRSMLASQRFKLIGKSVATNIEDGFTKLFNCVLNGRGY